MRCSRIASLDFSGIRKTSGRDRGWIARWTLRRGVDPLDAEAAVLVGREDLAFGPEADVAGEHLAPVILRREVDRGAGERLTVPIDQPPDGRAAGGESNFHRILAGLEKDRAGESPLLMDERGRAGLSGFEADHLERLVVERLDLPVGGQTINDDAGYRLAFGVDQPAFTR